MIQISKTKYRTQRKVLETFEKLLIVTRLTKRSEGETKYTEMFVLGSDYRIEMDEQTLKHLYIRIGEVLEGSDRGATKEN